MVVPLVCFHREEDVEAGVREEPVVSGQWSVVSGRNGSRLLVPDRRQADSGVGDDRAAGFEQERESVEQVSGPAVVGEIFSFLPGFADCLSRVTWVLWILVDITSIGLYSVKGVKLISLEFVIFLALAVLGIFTWSRLLRAQKEEVQILEV